MIAKNLNLQTLLLLGFTHFLRDPIHCALQLLMRVRSQSRHDLDLIRINRVFFELLHNEFQSVLDPERFTFKGKTSLKLLVVLDRVFELLSRFASLSVYRIDVLARALISESHKGELLSINHKIRKPRVRTHCFVFVTGS
jgi:hypothetical protein